MIYIGTDCLHIVQRGKGQSTHTETYTQMKIEIVIISVHVYLLSALRFECRANKCSPGYRGFQLQPATSTLALHRQVLQVQSEP